MWTVDLIDWSEYGWGYEVVYLLDDVRVLGEWFGDWLGAVELFNEIQAGL